METGFLNFHDEEHFTTEVYEQSNGFESESSLFGGFMADYSGQFDALPMHWAGNETELNEAESDSGVKDEKEDFQKTFQDWQHHISTLQARECENKNGLLCEPVPSSMPDIFGASTSEEHSKRLPVNDHFPNVTEEETYEASKFIEENILNTIKTEDLESPIKLEEDDCVDVETIAETMPVLEAGDLTTLLEQFEASEAVNMKTNATILPNPVIKAMKTNSPPKDPANKVIWDALPKEVINRIKESSKRKKGISLVPAARMPPCRSGTRMQDAGATLSRNKFLSIVSGSSHGESVKLDHDYCSNSACHTETHHKFYESEQNDFVKEDCLVDGGKEKWENSKKDSGLESGEMSDASEGSLEKSKRSISLITNQVKPREIILLPSLKIESSDMPRVSLLKPISEIKQEPREIQIQLLKEGSQVKPGESILMPVKEELIDNDVSGVSLLKPLSEIKQEPVEEEYQGEHVEIKQEEKKKKKLNIEEYRKRRRNMKCPESSHSSDNQQTMNNHFLTLSDSTTSNVTGEKDNQNDQRCMVNAEVQTQGLEAKKRERNRSLSKERSSTRSRRRYRSCSSSSSSSDSRRSDHSSRRRGRSRRRYSRSRGPRSIWSSSRSRSSSSCSYSSYSSRSRSRSRSRGSRWRHRSRSNYRRNNSYSRRSRYTPPRGARRQDDWNPTEKLRQVEERRVIYVGQIEEGTTKAQLRERFQSFGPIVDISLHFRERGDNYGFVTFGYKVDAYEAVEHGNDNPDEPHYDICFGGRRAFCQQRYSDLDGLSTQGFGPYQQNGRTNNSFDNLLREAQANIRKRSNV